MLEIGQSAPDFTLPLSGGADFNLKSQKPKNVVLFFYPKDDTKGCTVEALDFTARAAEFESANTIVIGISKDPIVKHEKFIAKHELNVRLASDADGTVCEDWGVWVEKKMYGKTFFGIQRTTFLINGNGEITEIWPKVKVPNHAQAVLSAAQELE